MNLLKAYGDRVLLLFILPPSIPVLEERLRSRQGDSPSAIETRLKNAYNELEWKKFFDYQIVNDNLEKAYQELKTIVQKECF
jgi:guanylate kinase